MDNNSELRTSPKRVAILVAQQSLIIHGGIGQFTKGFCDMAKDLGWEVDLIMDGHTSEAALTMLSYMRSTGWAGWTWFPDQPLRYADYQDTIENRHKDGINFEKAINFRQAMFRALQHGHDYDLIICNNPEAFLPVYSMGLTSKIPTVFYTHNENFIGIEDNVGPFSDEYNKVYRLMLNLPNIIVGTQTEENVKRMDRMHIAPATYLPMPLPDREILKPYTNKADTRQGVLFIGRWEDRKDPKVFLKIIKETGLPARVVTNDVGAIKFREAFAELGIHGFEIMHSLDSYAMAQTIREASIYVSTAKKEAFCYAAFECIPHCHVVLLDEYDWSLPFKNMPNVHRVPKKHAAAIVKQLHLQPVDHRAGMAVLKRYQDLAQTTWASFVATHPKSDVKIPQFCKQESAGVDALFT